MGLMTQVMFGSHKMAGEDRLLSVASDLHTWYKRAVDRPIRDSLPYPELSSKLVLDMHTIVSS